jgi:hypothetical protein
MGVVLGAGNTVCVHTHIYKKFVVCSKETEVAVYTSIYMMYNTHTHIYIYIYKFIYIYIYTENGTNGKWQLPFSVCCCK